MNPDIATGVLQQIYQMNAMINGGMSAEDAAGVMSIQIDAQVERLGKDQMPATIFSVRFRQSFAP